ncbi:murein DD-endopeptidase MepM/ murein hydrolase activator NlpD [Mumia flava]|uniref:Murein DD-endopeptidase MepM/ murein hydrolase activator NlpD n=1 Tax=Mumia flava TaxID=1348852 RepID=A0A2M9BKG2_9ACTN|nr:murein DD-endopeptidase MepM/ murein hydrolase activator NlpD [Mumia flava]
MTSRPAPKRRAEKPRKRFSRPATSADETGSIGRRSAGKPQDEPRAERTSEADQGSVRPSGATPPERGTSRSSASWSEAPASPYRAALRDTPTEPAQSPAPGSSAYRGKRAAELPPIPSDATTQIDAVGPRTTVTERRSGESRSSRRPVPPGSRSTRVRTRRRLPAPALVGAAALVIAGVGAVALSSAKPPVIEAVDYQALSASVDGAASKRYDPNNPDVTRDFDRAMLDKQVEAQAEQLQASLEQLAAKAEHRSEQIERNQWVIPLTGYRLTARFGQSSSLWSTVHTGLDFAAPSGTPLVAIARGTITETGYDGAYGNKTVLTLEDGTEIWYCHQSSISVSVGESVEPGQTIGTVGSTGNTTGPHLHLEVRPTADTPVDPLPALHEHHVFP